MFNKKGLSNVIVTLIMIVVALIAVGLIWGVVSNILESGTEDISSSFGLLYLNLEIQKVFIEDTGDISINVKRNLGKGNLTGIKFVVSDGINNEVIEKSTTLQELGRSTFTIEKAEFETLGTIKEISIAPILESNSGKKTLGNIVDTFNIITSGSGSNGGNGGNGDNETNGGNSCPEESVTYQLTLGPDAINADCQPNDSEWSYDDCSAVGDSSGWGSWTDYADGSKLSYVACPWTDTIPTGSTITNIIIDPVDVAKFQYGFADWYVNNLLLLDNDDLGNVQNDCNSPATDLPNPITLTNSVQFSNYNIGGLNNIFIYKQAGSAYILNGGDSRIDITVRYIPLLC